MGRMGCPALQAWREGGKALGSRASCSGGCAGYAPGLLLAAGTVPPTSGWGRERNYCKWKRQVSLVSWTSGLGKHVSEDDSSGRVSFPPLSPHLCPQVRRGLLSA